MRGPSRRRSPPWCSDMPFMFRSGEDDFDTLKTIDAMEHAGAVVVAITSAGTATFVGALASHQRFQIWARIENDAHIERVDDAISEALGD